MNLGLDDSGWPDYVSLIETTLRRLHFETVSEPEETDCPVCKRPYHDVGDYEPACHPIRFRPCGHVFGHHCYNMYKLNNGRGDLSCLHCRQRIGLVVFHRNDDMMSLLLHRIINTQVFQWHMRMMPVRSSLYNPIFQFAASMLVIFPKTILIWMWPFFVYDLVHALRKPTSMQQPQLFNDWGMSFTYFFIALGACVIQVHRCRPQAPIRPVRIWSDAMADWPILMAVAAGLPETDALQVFLGVVVVYLSVVMFVFWLVAYKTIVRREQLWGPLPETETPN